MALDINILKIVKKTEHELNWISVDNYRDELKIKFHSFLQLKEFKHDEESITETGLAFEDVPIQLERGVITKYSVT